MCPKAQSGTLKKTKKAQSAERSSAWPSVGSGFLLPPPHGTASGREGTCIKCLFLDLRPQPANKSKCMGTLGLPEALPFSWSSTRSSWPWAVTVQSPVMIQNPRPNEMPLGRAVYWKFWHLSMTDFATFMLEKRLIVFSPRWADCRFFFFNSLSFPFSYSFPRG